MKRQTNFILFSITLVYSLLSSCLYAQGITIESGTTFSLGSATLTLPGNYVNSGTLVAGTGTIAFNGASADQSIAVSDVDTFYNITINKAAGDVLLSGNIVVDGTITLTSGDLDLGGSVIMLRNSAILSETSGNTVKGAGAIGGYISLNAPSSVNAFGLGAVITSSEDLGLTGVVRGHTEQTSNASSSILRYYDMQPSNDTDLDATLVFTYDESELNSQAEGSLQMYRSDDDGTTWSYAGGTPNTSSNTVTLTGINSLTSRFTVSSEGAFPVELVSFTASANANNINLKWQTATETNNYGFEVERLKDSKIEKYKDSEPGWEKISFVEGNGNSSSVKEYSYSDDLSKFRYSGIVKYRLKQIDNDGTFSYSDITEVEVTAPKEFLLYNNYPNPFNPGTVIEFTVPENGITQLKVYNITGEEIATLFNEIAEAGTYYRVQFDASSLAAGIYIARLQSGSNLSTKKMTYLK